MRTSNYTEKVSAPVHIFRTITGRQLDLSSLTPKERSFLTMVLDKFQSNRKWNEFSSWWMAQFDRSGLTKESTAYALCEDLEARLGISQGDFDLPDYRDSLEELIEERYGSHSRFCKERDVDPSYLSRLLNRGSGLRVENLEKLLKILDAVLLVTRKEDLLAESNVEEASKALRTLLRGST